MWWDRRQLDEEERERQQKRKKKQKNLRQQEEDEETDEYLSRPVQSYFNEQKSVFDTKTFTGIDTKKSVFTDSAQFHAKP